MLPIAWAPFLRDSSSERVFVPLRALHSDAGFKPGGVYSYIYWFVPVRCFESVPCDFNRQPLG